MKASGPVQTGDTSPVTAVIPCFRNATTLRRAVKSVFAQTNRPREVIVVDDASDDEDTEVLLSVLEVEYGDLVKVIRLDSNGGPSGARNRGWEAASQPFIAFLDADDAWHHEKIALQMPLMLGPHGASISGHPISINTFFKCDANVDVEHLARPLRIGQLLFRNQLLTSSVIVKASLQQRFDPSRRLCEDYDLWLRILMAGEFCRYLPIPLTTTFKASFGEGGLSKDLFAMEQAQAGVYRGLVADRLISTPTYAALVVWGWVRFARRVAISKTRQPLRKLRRES